MLLYEGGEAWRLDDWAVSAGVRGVRRVLADLDMTDPLEPVAPEPVQECRSSGWVRARHTGILRLDVALG
ncbi:Succinylglutamate desuccinylase/aspartoacylase (fragment) [Nostocoides australiense Ben110]|uniref:Succinylglutamate desuccinylase/aspartoacylase n=1 Tax=Nostocoides australiense Ben110 TaxID=1193182 RepID=W6JWH3_9MICO